jgi:ribosomal protein S18 acetylase RimI-like enzyme
VQRQTDGLRRLRATTALRGLPSAKSLHALAADVSAPEKKMTTHAPLAIRAVPSTKWDELLPYMERLLRSSGRNGAPHFSASRDRNVYDKTFNDRLRAQLALPLERRGWVRLWVAVAKNQNGGDEVLGHVDLRASDRLADAHRVLLGLGIAEAHRGRGLGRLLTQYAIDWARTNRFDWMDLAVFTQNTVAVELYKKLGFVQTGYYVDRFRFDGESIDEFSMALDLRQKR